MKATLLSLFALLISCATAGYLFFDRVGSEREPERAKWPDFMQELYLTDCQEEQGYTEDQCACALDEIQPLMSMGDLVMIGLAVWSVSLADDADAQEGRQALESFAGPIKDKCGVDLLGDSLGEGQ